MNAPVSIATSDFVTIVAPAATNAIATVATNRMSNHVSILDTYTDSLILMSP